MAKGKIIKALSGFYYVLDEGQVIQCRGRGVFRKNKITPLVGDTVIYEADHDKEGYIMEVLDRKNELQRPPIANVDQGMIVFSAKEPNFSDRLLDRFLVILAFNQIEPLICITKMDLLDEQEQVIIEKAVEAYRTIGYNVILTSSQTKEGIESLRTFLSGKTSVFAGQSGVGKSTLLNALRPDLNLKTSEISTHLGRGKHTTRHVELIAIENGLVADTPGFSSIELTMIEKEQLATLFPEMLMRRGKCKFRGCLHENEPQCAVKLAVEAGEIPSFRYHNYLHFLKEIKERKPRY